MTPQKIDITINDKDYTIVILSYTPADPGVTGGRPEDCYPPEPSEAEFDLVDSSGMLCNAKAMEYADIIMDKIDEFMEDYGR